MYNKPEWMMTISASIIDYLRASLEDPNIVGRTEKEIVEKVGEVCPNNSLAIKVVLSILVDKNVVVSYMATEDEVPRELSEDSYDIYGGTKYVDIFYLRCYEPTNC